MHKSSHILTLLKQSYTNPKLLNQILAQATTAGLLKTTSLTWNCIIRAYAKSPTPIQAILIYNHFMQVSSLFPDNHTYPALLKACTRLLSLPKGREIHAHVTKIGLDHDIYVQNSLIHMYGAMLEFADDARRLFDEMTHRDLTTWNSILAAYISTPGFQGEAFDLFREMVSSGVVADEITLLILFPGYEHGELNCGRMIHGYALKHGFSFNVKLGNTILNRYAKAGEMDCAFQVFEEMDWRDTVSHTILISGYIELGLLDLARSIFDRMPSRDVVLWNSMINGYMKAKCPIEALELFKQMETWMVNPDEVTIVSVLSACASLSDLQFGRSVHRFFRRTNINEDVFVGTSLVNMYAKCGSLEEAVLTFYKMRYKDVFAWTSIISGFAIYGHGEEALELFSQMQREGVEPNEATFVAVLMACSHSGLVDEAQFWFGQMVEAFSIQPTIEHLGCMINLLSRARLLCKAEELIGTLPVQERIIAYKILLSACISYGDVGHGGKVAEELIKLDTKSHGVYVLLSNFYAFAGQWDDVAEMRRIARNLDIRKEAGTSLIEANA